MLSKDFKEFIESLIANRVEYLIVGGYAVAVHGYPRYTGDLDIWLNATAENAVRILKAINDLGFHFSNLSADDFTKEGNVIQLGNPPLRIDLLTQVDGVGFIECFSNKKTVNVDNLNVNFISYNDLLKNKAASGRLIDQNDLKNLNPE